MTGGWWRRNRWGLIGLVPAMALALAVPAYEAYPAFWGYSPHTAVTATSNGWVTYANARIRLTAINAETRLVGFGGDPVTLPAGLRAWSATVTFEAAQPTALGGCAVWLTDRAGHTYSMNPTELTDAGADVSFSICAPDDSTGKPPTTWTNVFYFVTPADAVPVDIGLSLDGQLPRFARLTPEFG